MSSNRYRWYLVGASLSFPDFVRLVQDDLYLDDKDSGFDFWDLKRRSFTARYIAKRMVGVERVDPFGRVSVLEDVVFSYVEFEISLVRKGLYLLKVVNPPASLKKFMWAIGSICGDRSYVDPVRFSLDDLYEDYRRDSGFSRVSVRSLRVKNVSVSPDALGRVDLISQRDAYKELRSWLAGRKYTIDRLNIIGYEDGNEVAVQISSSGLIRCDSVHSEFFTSYISRLQ